MFPSACQAENQHNQCLFFLMTPPVNAARKSTGKWQTYCFPFTKARSITSLSKPLCDYYSILKCAMDLYRYDREIPDAYERLLLDAIEGERRLFIRSDELDAAWALFTPLLNELEKRKISPELYPYGSRGPVGAHYLAAKYNVRWGDNSSELDSA